MITNIITFSLLSRFLDKLRTELTMQYQNKINYKYYCGVGDSDTDINTSYTSPTSINLTGTNSYIFLIFPSSESPNAYMSGFPIPFDATGTKTIDNKQYSILKSKNAYTGTFKIEIK